ncbi:acyl carrier protein [Streptomyces sp. NPDC001985]|uniref:acyl carrier protein n=1 Tax=Streptomyces sp. NPDC001985 TaxID=3154406 RepID=UPI003317AAF0
MDDMRVTPSGEDIESELLHIFRKVLSREDISPEGDFFVHGGNSLLAMRLTETIQQSFGVDVPPRSFYRSPTVAGLTRVVTDLCSTTPHHDGSEPA